MNTFTSRDFLLKICLEPFLYSHFVKLILQPLLKIKSKCYNSKRSSLLYGLLGKKNPNGHVVNSSYRYDKMKLQMNHFATL